MAVIASVYHDRLVCPFDQYRDFLNYMTGHDLYLYDLPRARRIVADVLDNRIPGLKKTTPPPEKTDSGNANKYVRDVCKELSADTWTLGPLKAGAFTPRTPQEAMGAGRAV